ncbi:unnamed protein product, partial [Rotaria sp. Silwood2]
PGSPIFTVLHLSDIHVDFPYTPESQGDCPQPLFCRCDQQIPCNILPTPNIRSDNISWLYQILADNWIKLGLPANTRQSI